MKYFFITIFQLLVCNLSYAGGVAVGNGGTVVICSGDNHLKSLDYVLIKSAQGKKFSIVPVQNLEESFRRIGEILKNENQKLYESFTEFVKMIGNSDRSLTYTWVAKPMGLELVREEIFLLPQPCRDRFGQGMPLLYQAIVRKVVQKEKIKSEVVVFEFDPVLFLEIQKNPIQASFLLVHEWLWSVTDNIEENRKLNYRLHSTQP